MKFKLSGQGRIGKNLASFFGDGTSVKIPSEIRLPEIDIMYKKFIKVCLKISGHFFIHFIHSLATKCLMQESKQQQQKSSFYVKSRSRGLSSKKKNDS